MIPTLFHLGPIPVHSFGLLVVCTFLAAWARLTIDLKRFGRSPELAEPIVFWGAVGGLVGARLLFILSFPQEFVRDPLSAIISGGGFTFYGGLICGALSVYLVVRRQGLSFLTGGDLVSPALAIGYAVGRVGCHLSGDGDYGSPTTLPWGFSYELGYVPTPPGVLVHPTPIYETLMSLGIALILIRLISRRTFDGQPTGRLFGTYLVLSSLARFGVEFLRIEPIVWSGLTQAQVTSLALFPFGLWLLLRRSSAAPDDMAQNTPNPRASLSK